MKPAQFDYEAPRDLGEALEVLERLGEEGKVLAGGQSLVPLLNFRLARPATLIDVNRLDALDHLRREGGRLRIGALTRHAAAERSPLVCARWPLISEAMHWLAHPQIRNRGTVGGSAAHADPAAELPVVFTALDARFHVQSRARGARVLGCAEMFRGQLESGLEYDELLCEIEVPAMADGAGSAFTEFARRQGDFALGGAAAVVELDGDRICQRAAVALLGAGPVPLRATGAEQVLVGRRVDSEAAREAASIAVAGVRPTGDIHGDSSYRRDLIETLVQRALLTAESRAGTRSAANGRAV